MPLTILTWAVGLLFPRILSLYLWFRTEWFIGLFPALWMPIVAFLLLPRVLLWYTVVVHMFDGAWGPLQIAGMCIAVLLDVAGWKILDGKRPELN